MHTKRQERDLISNMYVDLMYYAGTDSVKHVLVLQSMRLIFILAASTTTFHRSMKIHGN